MENQQQNITPNVNPEIGVQFVPKEKVEEQKKTTILPITNISQLMMYQSGTPTTAPTHSPRNFFEQLVFKDNGTSPVLWVWSQYDKTWNQVGNVLTSKARAYLSGNQSIAPGAEVLITLDAESYDEDSEFNTGTYLFTATSAGYYLVAAAAWLDVATADKQYSLSIMKNEGAARICRAIGHSSHINNMTLTVSDVVSLAAGDKVSLYVGHNEGANINVTAGEANTFLSIHRLS